MTPRSFEYFAPKTLAQARNLLVKYKDAKVLAGGQSLLALMKLRLSSPSHLIDINNIKGMSYIKLQDGKIRIGAMTTHDMVDNSPIIRKNCLLLSEAASRIGDQQIRNRGTIGGSVCHSDPAADMPTALVAADASFTVVKKRGRRIIPARDFFVDFFKNKLARTDILTEVTVPVLPARSGSTYMKLSRRAGDFAIVGAAAVVCLGKEDLCTDVRLALGAVGPTPIRALKVEESLKGKVLTDDLIVQAAQLAPEGVDPPSDIHGSAEYRREMTKVMAKRAIREAWRRAKG